MLLTKRNNVGQIECCIEVQPVNCAGTFDINGSYLWIEQFDLSKGCSFKLCLSHMIGILDVLMPKIEFIYWKRLDKTGSRLHAYSRQRCLELLDKEQKCSY